MAVQDRTGGVTAPAVGLQPLQSKKGFAGEDGKVFQRRRRHGGPCGLRGDDDKRQRFPSDYGRWRTSTPFGGWKENVRSGIETFSLRSRKATG
jgi:hypothetical protein